MPSSSLGDAVLDLSTDNKGLEAGLEAGRKKAERWSKDLGESLKKTGTMMSALALPIAAVGGAALKAGLDFNRGLGNIETLIPGQTKRIEELRKGIQNLSPAIGKSTADLTSGMYQVISAFGDGAEAMTQLEITAKAAAAGGATTTESLNLLSAVTKGYGDTSAAAIQKAADLSFQTVKLGQTDFPQLASSIGKVVPLAASLGVAQEDLFGVMATGTGVTGTAAEVSTQLRGVLQALLAPTADMEEAYKGMGVESGKAALEQFGLQGTIEKVVAVADAAGAPLTKYLGSIEGTTLALALAGPQADVFTEKTRAMHQATGAASEAFDAMSGGVNKAGFTWDQLTARAGVLSEKFGQAVIPAFIATMDAAGPLLDWIESAIVSFGTLDPILQASAIAIAALAVAAGPVVYALGTLVTSAAALGPVIAALTGPIGLTVAAVAGLTAGIGLMLAKKAEVDAQFAEQAELKGYIDELDRIGVVMSQQTGETWPEYAGRIKETAKEFNLVAESAGEALKAFSAYDANRQKQKALSDQARRAIEQMNAELQKEAAHQKQAAEATANNTAMMEQLTGGAKKGKDALAAYDTLMAALSGTTRKAGEETETTGRKVALTEAQLRKIKEAAEKVKLEFRDLVFPLIDATEGLTKMDAAGQRVFQTWDEIKKSLEAARPALTDIEGGMASIGTVVIETGRAVEAFGDATKVAHGAAGDFKPKLDEYNQAMKDLGVTSQEVANKKLADLRESLERVRAEVQKHPEKMGDLKRAQEAYDKAAGISTEKTGLWDKSLKQVSTVLTDLGSDLAGRFSAAVKTGIGPIDDFTKAIIRLVSEEVMGLMIKQLGKLIDHIPGLEKLGGILKNIGGGGGKGPVQLPGTGGDGGQAGAGSGGGGDPLGGIAGWISAGSNVIQNFQMKAMNKTLDLIEHEVRFSQIHLLHILENWNHAYHGSGSWAWLLRGDTAAIAATLKGGIVLAQGTTAVLTKAIDDGAAEIVEPLEAVAQAVDTVDKSLDKVDESIRDFRGRTGTGLDKVDESIRDFRGRTGEGLDKVDESIRTSRGRTGALLGAVDESIRDFRGRAGKALDSINESVREFGAKSSDRLDKLAELVDAGNQLAKQDFQGRARTGGSPSGPFPGPPTPVRDFWLRYVRGGPGSFVGWPTNPPPLPPPTNRRDPSVPDRGTRSFQSGIDFLPKDTLALLHRGEAVIPAEENRGRMGAKQPVEIRVVLQTGKEIARALIPDINELVKRNRYQLTASGVVA